LYERECAQSKGAVREKGEEIGKEEEGNYRTEKAVVPP
jgi:hypothetical protein